MLVPGCKQNPFSFSKITNECASVREQYGNNGLPVEVISPLVPRKDNSQDLFAEGEVFSGIESRGLYDAWVTPVASPHVTPSIDTDEFIGAASEVFGLSAELTPAMSTVQAMPAQAVVWWRARGRNDGNNFDLPLMGDLPQKERLDCFAVIGRQVCNAVLLVNKLRDKPVIWGSWGNTNKTKTFMSGMGRGVPTNLQGHVHVTSFSGSQRNVVREECDLQAQLNHHALLGSLVHREYGEMVSQAICAILQRDLSVGTSVSVRPYNEQVSIDNTMALKSNGYNIEFSHPVDFESTMAAISKIAANFERLYCSARESHAMFQLFREDSAVAEELFSNLAYSFVRCGFDIEQSEELTAFSLGIRPTYSQVCTWVEDLDSDSSSLGKVEARRLLDLKERYEKSRTSLRKKQKVWPLAVAVIGAALSDRDSSDHPGVLSERASATYVIDDYELGSTGLRLSAFKIIPGVDSTQSGPEHKTGRTLRRQQ